MKKRNFLKSSTLLIASTTANFFIPKAAANQNNKLQFNEDVNNDKYADINDEDKWQKIRKQYILPDFINLENGYFCISPQPILSKYFDHINEVNKLGAYYMRNYQYDNKNKARNKLSMMLGCDPEELIITRNTTESLDMIIGGLDWQKGDEAIMSNQDYGAMLDMFAQVEKRYGITNKIIKIPLNPASDEEIVKCYEDQITPQTKLIMICHMINITGHILPVKKVADMAHRYNVKVMVDGAHCIAHIDFKMSDLNCDFYGASLHKWLSNPIGAGILYIKKEHINSVYPVFAENEKSAKGIERLNHTGTHPVFTDLTINTSIDYYLAIGRNEKEDRLRYLQNYWMDALRGLNNIVINTPYDKQRSCGIGNVGIKNIKPRDLASRLYSEHGIFTVAIDHEDVKGCRITPNLYTTKKELDAFINAMKKLAN